MTYAAEPYAQFVDDLLGALTGGATREQFRFLPENEPFRLAPPGPIIPNTVRIYGQADHVYHRFRLQTDFALATDNSVQWAIAPDGTPAADAVLPDQGSVFFVNYEYQGAPRQLTDRNPGSITRLFAESFAREFAVLSRQMEAVYQAGFVETASGRDLEQLAALVGVTRRRTISASGSVLFGRATPAPADVFIPAGTKLSTAEPPAVVFETSEDRTLRQGGLSVDAPVQALVPGKSGVVVANAIRVIHRPILGIDSVANPQATQFSGADENDDALRARVRRALEGAGKATTGALLGALTTLPGLREKDVRIAEDYLAHPGVVKLTVALPEMPTAEERQRVAEQAVALIEATRPVGVRIEHTIDAPLPPGAATPGPGLGADGEGDPATAGTATPADSTFMRVDVKVDLTPTTLALTVAAKEDLVHRAQAVIEAFLDEAGIGETLIYNRLVAQLMALESVLDVVVEIYPQDNPAVSHRKNIVPNNPAVRPSKGDITVQIGGSLIVLDVQAAITLTGLGTLGDPAAATAVALSEIEAALKAGVAEIRDGVLNVNRLQTIIGTPENYSATLHYQAEYVDAGVRIHQQDVQLPLTGVERLWIRKVSALGGSGT